jgi:diguanylate cyclase
MSVWDKIGPRSLRALRALRLDTINGQFVVFAVVATLFTTLVMALALPGGNRRSVGDRVDLELKGASADVAREMGVWTDQRVVDLRLRASPYVVSDNLARATSKGHGAEQALVRLHDYLNSVRQNLPGHEGLAIVTPDGQVLTTSGSRTGFRLSADRMNTLRASDVLIGEPLWDPSVSKATMVIAVPIRRDDGFFLGALSAKINLDGVRDILEQRSQSHHVYLITEQGRTIISSTGTSADVMKSVLPAATTRELFEREGETVGQSRPEQGDVVAVLHGIPQLHWAVVAETPRAAATRETVAMRLRAVLLMLALVVALGVVAFLLGLVMTRPLARLTDAAARVASGDLSAELPAPGSGEIGYLTRAFNTMVSRLREKESQGELEKLSLTDALTGLYNRRHLMGTLASEVQRSRRLRRAFTVLIADVDKFKQYNDTHGHLAGDAALVKIAEAFRKTTRAVDCVARYGGEEFVVMLLECGMETAATVAERIRSHVEKQDVGEGRLTVSIGLAEYPDGGETPEELIATADAAMYQAKNSGRNRVVVGGAIQERPPEHTPERRATGRRKKEA